MLSIIDRLEDAAAAHPDRLLYSFLDAHGREKDAYTYLAFHERTRHLAHYLREHHGLRHGDRALLAYPPGLEIVAALVACARVGAIPVPVYPPSPMALASSLMKLGVVARDCEAVAVLTTRSIDRACGGRPGPAGPAGPETRLRWITTDDVKGVSSGGFCNTPHQVLLLQYTSGSTSEPRGVVVSHDNVLHNCAGVLDAAPVAASWLPQDHDMG